MTNIIIKGGLLGLTAGLAATIFDSLYIVVPEAYVPYEYPLLIFIINCFFWTSIGCVSGLLVYRFVRRGNTPHKREYYYWILFFLLPFALLYGIFWEDLMINIIFTRASIIIWFFCGLLFLSLQS